MLGYLEDLKTIAEINPDALVVSVSMNNSLEDVVLVMGGADQVDTIMNAVTEAAADVYTDVGSVMTVLG